MRIASTLIRYRDVVTCDAFVSGRHWSSSATGSSLIVAGSPGDADDPGRASRPYVEDDRLSWKDMPELRELFPGCKLVRRLAPDGSYDRNEELLCIPVSGDGAIREVRLLGYGPDEWLPDGITGKEIESRDRASHGWRPHFWPDPDRMAFLPSLTAGQIIRSEQFAYARPRRQPDGTTVATLYHEPLDPARFDADRGTALYRVEGVEIREEWTDLGEYYSCRIRARRLHADGTDDPQAEFLEFQQQMDVKDEPQGRPFRPVELVSGR